jgi:hypothetical protein
MQIETGEDTGFAGFVPEMWRNWENYMPSAGAGFGHDIIEHLGEQTGAFDEELAAHGGVLFTTEFLATENAHPIYTPAQSLASGMASSQWQESTVDHIRNPPRARLSWDERRELKEFVLEYVEAMAKEWKDEKGRDCYECETNDETDDDGEPTCVCVNPFEGKEAFRRIFGWMLYGYARAKRTYKGENFKAYQMKKEVEKVSEKAMQNFGDYADSGAVFTMRLDFNRVEVTIKAPRDIYDPERW